MSQVVMKISGTSLSKVTCGLKLYVRSAVEVLSSEYNFDLEEGLGLLGDIVVETKLRRLSVVFDVMGYMQQLRRVCGGQLFQTAPSTLQMAEDPTEEPRIVFALQAPFRIRSINEAWMMHYGVTVEDCQNRCMVLERNPLCPLPALPPGAAEGGTEAKPPVDSALQYIQFAYECVAKQLSHSLVVLYHTKTQGAIGTYLPSLLPSLPSSLIPSTPPTIFPSVSILPPLL